MLIAINIDTLFLTRLKTQFFCGYIECFLKFKLLSIKKPRYLIVYTFQ